MTAPIAAAQAIVAAAQTDADGRYSVSLPAPTIAGTFQLLAKFAGSQSCGRPLRAYRNTTAVSVAEIRERCQKAICKTLGDGRLRDASS